MGSKLKDTILGSVKIAASYSKPKATLEDFMISFLKNDSWIVNFLDYIGINSSDIETNFHDLEKLGTIDGNQGKDIKKQALLEKGDEGIEKLFGALAENIFSSMGREEFPTPFDINTS